MAAKVLHMMKDGIIDPVKMIQTVLQGAARYNFSSLTIYFMYDHDRSNQSCLTICASVVLYNVYPLITTIEVADEQNGF